MSQIETVVQFFEVGLILPLKLGSKCWKNNTDHDLSERIDLAPSCASLYVYCATDALSRKWFACKIAAFMSYPPLSTFSKKRRIEVYDCRYRVILCFEKNPTTACDIILCLSLDSETIFKALIKYIRKRQKWSCVEWNLLWHSLPVFLTFSRWEKVIIYESLSTLPKSLCLLPAISIERSSLV